MTPRTARQVHFAIPGDLARPTGGYGYDREVIAGLGKFGWAVRHMPLADGFPHPDRAAMEDARTRFKALPDGAVVLCDGLAFGVLPEIAARHGQRLRLVALVHHPLCDETGNAPGVAAWLAAQERAALAHARQVICTSHTTAARLRSFLGVAKARLTVAPPGTRPAPWADRSRRAGAPGPAAVPMILSVGALSPRKGHDVLIAALAGLTDLPWQARIVGPRSDPATAEALAAQIAQAGLTDRITLAGPVADTGAEYARADLFALATRHEGFGMALAEALSHGLPVVTTTAGAVPEVVSPRAGALVPPDDACALRAALDRLLRDPEAREQAAAAARAAAQALPRWEDAVATIARVLDQVAAEATGLKAGA